MHGVNTNNYIREPSCIKEQSRLFICLTKNGMNIGWNKWEGVRDGVAVAVFWNVFWGLSQRPGKKVIYMKNTSIICYSKRIMTHRIQHNPYSPGDVSSPIVAAGENWPTKNLQHLNQFTISHYIVADIIHVNFRFSRTHYVGHRHYTPVSISLPLSNHSQSEKTQ